MNASAGVSPEGGPRAGAGGGSGGSPRRTSATLNTVRRVGSLVAIALIGGGMLMHAARAMRYHDTTPRSLPANLHRLVVEAGDGDVDVRPSGEASARATPDARWTWMRPRIEISTADAGAQAVVRSSCPGWTPLPGCSVRWRLEVPDGTEVVLNTTRGDVDARDLRGPVSAVTTSGDVELHRVEATAVNARTTTGDVTLDRVRAPQVSARTTTGDIVMRRGGAPAVVVESTTGEVTVDSSLALDRLDATTTTGDVDVTVPRDAMGYRIERSGGTGSHRLEVLDDASSERTLRLDSTTGELTVTYAD